MKIILLIAAYMFIPIVAKVWLNNRLNSYKSHDSLVSYRPYVLMIGAADTVFFLAVATIATIMDGFSWFVVLTCFLFVLLGVFVLVCYFNCRIQFDESAFTVTGFFGKERTYTYNEITGIKNEVTAQVLYCGQQRVEVASIAAGSVEFLTMAQRQYKHFHGGAAIPNAKVEKRDLFNGHIRSPLEFVISYVLVFLLTVVMIVMVVVLFQRTYDETNTTRKDCFFTSCEIVDQELVFLSDEGELYKMEFAPEAELVSRLRILCDGKTLLTVYAREATPENEEPYYGIEQIQTEETVVLSFEQSREIDWEKNGRWAVLLIGVMITLCWSFIGLSILIGRNPSKFPRFVVKLFFKEQYILYDE